MSYRRRIAALVIGAPLVLLFFQNCGDFALQDEVLYQQSLYEQGLALDQKYLQELTQGSSLVYHNKNATGDTIKANPLLASAFSIAAVVERTASGSVVAMNSGANSEEGALIFAGGKIRARRLSSANNYSYVEVSLPSGGDLVVVGATFGEKAGEITLMINGIIQVATTQKAGTPLDFSYLSKSVILASPAAQVVDVMAYDRALGAAELNVISRYMGAQLGLSYVFVDPSLLGSGGGNGGGGELSPAEQKFIAVKAILDAKCMSCHASGSSYGDFQSLTSSTAVSRSLVVPGSPTTSKLYYRLTGSSGGSGPKNMPTSGSISASEVQAVADWIISLGN